MDPNDPKIQESAKELAQPKRDIRGLLASPEFEKAVRAALPKHVTADRFIRVALTATMRQPDLLDCSKESFFLRMLELSALGIEPDGRRAHLIPFWNHKFCKNCQHPSDKHQGQICRIAGCKCEKKESRREVNLIIDYKGLAELVRRSGDVSYMHCDAVYTHDEWDFCFGSGSFLRHKPNLDVEDRGEIRAVYSFVKMTNGDVDFAVMSMGQVAAIRKRSQASESGPWVTDFAEMAKKTIFRNHSKWLPLSPEIKIAIDHGSDSLLLEAGENDVIALPTIGVDESREARLDRQMKEQAEAGTSTAGTTQENTKPQSDESEPPQKGGGIGPPWADRAVMELAFNVLLRELGDTAFWTIVGTAGFSSLADINFSVPVSPATANLFGSLMAAVADLKSTDESTPPPSGDNTNKEKFSFGKGKK